MELYICRKVFLSVVMRHTICVIFTIVLIFPLLTHNVSAADSSVSVTIPTFKVTVNDRTVDSTRLQYPLISYKGITYFPLTWRWCRELGLVSGYTDTDGLYIANDIAESQETLDKGGYQAAGSRYIAVIPDYPVFINGRQINNNKEEYPLLNFRNITYFPLTWRFVTGEFGWDQTWSDKSGYRLCTYSSAAEPLPGTHYYEESLYKKEIYRDYAILEKMREERSIGTVADESGSYSNSYVGRTFTHYKLDYKTDTLTKIASVETSDTTYLSGSIRGEDASELFSRNGSVLCFRGNTLLDLSVDTGEDNAIDTVYATKYLVNGLNMYLTKVCFTQGDTCIPAPYTPTKYYAWTDNGDGVLRRVKSWPVDQILTAVYPFGTKGVYLCSSCRISGSSRYNNGRGWICILGSDLSETALNGRWKDWNSLDAIGMDDAGNLYLLNTLFSDYDVFNRGRGTVSAIRDGYYRLDTDGTLSKIYPFVRADEIFVTPVNGKIKCTVWGCGRKPGLGIRQEAVHVFL